MSSRDAQAKRLAPEAEVDGVRIETAHKVLIGSAIVFFAFFSVFEVMRWREGEAGALVWAVGGAAAAVAFAAYLRRYARGQKP